MTDPNNLFIVIVLYKRKLEDCLPLQFLLQNTQYCSLNYELLVYNNSEDITISFNEKYQVFNATENNMLVGAYNYALQRAKEQNAKWLLLLDQDTKLTDSYLEELSRLLNSDISQLGAVVPQVKKDKIFISPKTYFPKIGNSFFVRPLKTAGISEKCFMAINSGTVLNVNAVDEIGGFSEKYPLDGLDHWYFHQLYKRGKCVYVMNSIIEQNLSVLDYTGMSVNRYTSILNAELQFSKELGSPALFLWKVKIPLRAIKRFFTKGAKGYVLQTLSYFFK
jgi:GT2 family glycosyltransferase